MNWGGVGVNSYDFGLSWDGFGLNCVSWVSFDTNWNECGMN